MGTPDRQAQSAFVCDGFVVVERFLSPSEVARTQTLVESLLVSPPESACLRPHNTLLPLRWNNRVVQLLLASEHRMRVLAETLGGDDLKWISGYVSIKAAHSPALWWHQDWWCWDHAISYRRVAPQVAVLCYLTATDMRNGALRVLPGSHHKSFKLHAALPEPHALGANDLAQEHMAMCDQEDQVTLCLEAGDAVVIDYRLLHGTHGNMSAERRDCLLLSFTPSWRKLPVEIQSHLISHPAQPAADESPQPTGWEAGMLPSFAGIRKDLHVNRIPPPRFEVVD